MLWTLRARPWLVLQNGMKGPLEHALKGELKTCILRGIISGIKLAFLALCQTFTSLWLTSGLDKYGSLGGLDSFFTSLCSLNLPAVLLKWFNPTFRIWVIHKNKETNSQQTIFLLTNQPAALGLFPLLAPLWWLHQYFLTKLKPEILRSLVQTAAYLSSLIVDPDLVHLDFHLKPYLVPILFCLWAAGCIITSTTSIGIRK